MATIFLQENKSKVSTNTTTFVSGNLSRKEKALQGSNVMENFSLFGQYNAERDTCGKFRMIFAVNPICSNTIFNVKTEIMRNEGSAEVKVLTGETEQEVVTKESFLGRQNAVNVQNTAQLNRRQAIKNTEYSNPSNGNVTYHCGIDIFNNHMLRVNGFTHINPINNDDPASMAAHRVYNTLEDFRRNAEGITIKVAEQKKGVYDGSHSKPSHIYYTENLMSLRDAFGANLKEIDGWIGFTNLGTLDAPNIIVDNNKLCTVNRLFTNRKPCEFIDMYPGRDLYSFVPKYNESRKRAEKNWDYCITYPYEKDYEMINTVLHGEQSAIGADVFSGTNTSSVAIVTFRSMFKHTLKSNDIIYLYYYKTTDGVDVFTKYPIPVKVLSTGDYRNAEKDRYFTIRRSDIPTIPEEVIANGKIYYKKISHGSECEYYFRKYKKLKKQNGDELKSDINKIAYGENIYGDRVAQIVFTDDIDVDGLYDHLGRPLSEVYLTVVKRNAGHEEWNNKDYGNEAVEYSHCFGKNTAGVDFGAWGDVQVDYNVRCLHNIDTATTLPQGPQEFTYDHLGDVVTSGIPKTLQINNVDEITIENDEFFGDVVEFDPYNYTETEISKVMFRFNTLQRETVYPTSAASVLFYHKLEHDDYDMDGTGTLSSFRASEDAKTFNITMVDDGEGHSVEKYIPANINPEGYFYNPHNRVKIREDAEETTTVRAKRINYVLKEKTVAGGETVLKITAPVNYGFFAGDVMAFYRRPGEYGEDGYLQPQVFWGMISGVSGTTLDLVFSGQPFSTSITAATDFTKAYPCFYTEESVPTYASFHPSTQSFIWRENVLPSEMTMDMELYNTPFSNGRFYIEKNIAFFLRRQDPFGEIGLSMPKFRSEKIVKNPMNNFTVYGEKIDLSAVYNFLNNIDYTCY